MKNSYSRKIMLSFIGICLVLVLVSGLVFYSMSRKMVAEKHSLVISDYTKQTEFFVNRQMEKAQECAELLMFDDWFKYILRQSYDNYGAYDVITNQILPKCKSAFKVYGGHIEASLYVHNKTLNEHYYTQDKNGIDILYADRLDSDKTVTEMRRENSYIRWARSETDKEENMVSIYARLIDFGRMKEAGILLLRVPAESLFPELGGKDGAAVLFELDGGTFTAGELPDGAKDGGNYLVERTPLSIKGFELVSYVSKDYYGPQILESVKSILLVFLLTIPFMIILGFAFRRLLYRDVDMILNGIKRVQSGEEHVIIQGGKYAEFRQIADVLNEYIKSVEHLVQDVYEIEIQKQDIEFSMLQAKINPHFLYNIFTIMSEFAKAGFNEAVVRVLDKTAAFYRQILSKGTGDYTLREELDCVRAYMEIIDIIRPKEISIQYKTDDEILGAYMPRFLLQPIVENSVKHAVKGGQLLITVTARRGGDRLIIEVGDNGVGMTEEQVESCMRYKESGGYGIYNIISRLKLRYSEPDCGLKVFSRVGEGTTAVFTLPYTTDYPEDDMYE